MPAGAVAAAPLLLTYDDVLLAPRRSSVRSRADVATRSRLTRTLSVAVPIVAANMETVTEARMAVAMARAGAVGIIHRFLTVADQVGMVERVKRAENLVIQEPYRVAASATVGEARERMRASDVSSLLVVDDDGRLAGILTPRDLRLDPPADDPVTAHATPRERLVTAPPDTDLETARELLHRHRVEKLPLVDADGRPAGLITVRDLVALRERPHASKDARGRLLVGAAVGVRGRTIPVGAGLTALAVDPASHRVYVVNSADNSISVIDEADDAGNGTVIGTMAVPDPAYLAIDLSTHRLFVTSDDNHVLVINEIGAGGSITGSVPVIPFVTGLALDPSTHTIYVTHAGNTVSVIDEASLEVTGTIVVGAYPKGVAVDPATHRVYVSNFYSNSVSVIDDRSNTVIATIRVGNEPQSVSVDPTNHKVYVTDLSADAVSVIDESSLTVTGTIGVGSSPAAVTVDPTTHDVYVANAVDNTVSVIDGADHKLARLTVGTEPEALAVDPGNGNVYVADTAANTVSVITPPADLAMTVNGPPSATSPFSVSVTVTDHGPAPAARTTANLLVPQGLAVISAPATCSTPAPSSGRPGPSPPGRA